VSGDGETANTVKPGEVPVLAADEGLLLLSVDTTSS
jgi:hypothetical protein